ncbi:MAG: hypothetical protein HRU19_01210 [Pseudobacteriovorax sp.]|nr:hypothetical protein [Pseudobacteriovorax sp.]
MIKRLAKKPLSLMLLGALCLSGQTQADESRYISDTGTHFQPTFSTLGDLVISLPDPVLEADRLSEDMIKALGTVNVVVDHKGKKIVHLPPVSQTIETDRTFNYSNHEDVWFAIDLISKSLRKEMLLILESRANVEALLNPAESEDTEEQNQAASELLHLKRIQAIKTAVNDTNFDDVFIQMVKRGVALTGIGGVEVNNFNDAASLYALLKTLPVKTINVRASTTYDKFQIFAIRKFKEAYPGYTYERFKTRPFFKFNKKGILSTALDQGNEDNRSARNRFLLGLTARSQFAGDLSTLEVSSNGTNLSLPVKYDYANGVGDHYEMDQKSNEVVYDLPGSWTQEIPMSKPVDLKGKLKCSFNADVVYKKTISLKKDTSYAIFDNSRPYADEESTPIASCELFDEAGVQLTNQGILNRSALPSWVSEANFSQISAIISSATQKFMDRNLDKYEASIDLKNQMIAEATRRGEEFAASPIPTTKVRKWNTVRMTQCRNQIVGRQCKTKKKKVAGFTYKKKRSCWDVWDNVCTPYWHTYSYLETKKLDSYHVDRIDYERTIQETSEINLDINNLEDVSYQIDNSSSLCIIEKVATDGNSSKKQACTPFDRVMAQVVSTTDAPTPTTQVGTDDDPAPACDPYEDANCEIDTTIDPF